MRLTKTLLISAVLLMSATGMQAAGFNQNGNYLTVQLKQHQNFGPSQIRLQVVSDKIIRVQATAEQSFRNKQSLIIVPQKTARQIIRWKSRETISSLPLQLCVLS